MIPSRRIALAMYIYLVIVTIALAIVIASVLIVARELNLSTDVLAKTQVELADSQATLANTQNALASTERTLGSTQTELTETKATLASTENTLGSTQAELAETKTTLASTENTLGSTQSELAETKTTLASTENTLGSTQSELAQTKTTLASTENTLGSTQAELSETKTTLAELEGSVGRRDQVEGEVAEAKEELAGLEAEIEELNAKREPLILKPGDTYRIGFACTGSMEPVITCLDEATWLEDFRPEDITIGTVISFDPDCWEDAADGTGTAHRVVEIRVVNGVREFWPKGDNNEEADGCWVPETHIDGYITEIFKDVQPENAWLRDAVNDAEADYIEADDKRSDHREANGCHRTEGVCYFDAGFAYNKAKTLFANLERASDRYDCWLDVAGWSLPISPLITIECRNLGVRIPDDLPDDYWRW